MPRSCCGHGIQSSVSRTLDRSAGGAQGFVSRPCCRTVFFPLPPVLADRDDRNGITLDDGGVATARVIGPVSGYGADGLALRDLVERVWQHGAVPCPAGHCVSNVPRGAVATGGELDGADVGRGSIHGQMHLAPLASALDTVLARLPFAIAEELDADAVHQQVQRATGPSIRDLDSQGLLPATQRRVVRNRPI